MGTQGQSGSASPVPTCRLPHQLLPEVGCSGTNCFLGHAPLLHGWPCDAGTYLRSHLETSALPRAQHKWVPRGSRLNKLVSSSVEEVPATFLKPQVARVCLPTLGLGLGTGQISRPFKTDPASHCRAFQSLFKIEKAPDHLLLPPSCAVRPNTRRKTCGSCKRPASQVKEQRGIWLLARKVFDSGT